MDKFDFFFNEGIIIITFRSNSFRKIFGMFFFIFPVFFLSCYSFFFARCFSRSDTMTA